MDKNLNIPIYIFTTKFGYYISLVIKYLLEMNNISSIITFEINKSIDNLYIILFSQKVKVYPKNYVIYQLEQYKISKWIDNKYKLSILFSKKTFDYSHSNINKFDEILKKKINYFGIPLIKYSNLVNQELKLPESTDILFYGSMNEFRKNKINYLKNRLRNLNFKVINNIYGKDLFYEIYKSKIILNIHFYPNSILETCRINEALSCKKLVISLKPNPIDKFNYNLYRDCVVFAENIDDMYNKILFYLFDRYEYNNIINKIKYEDNYESILEFIKN